MADEVEDGRLAVLGYIGNVRVRMMPWPGIYLSPGFAARARESFARVEGRVFAVFEA